MDDKNQQSQQNIPIEPAHSPGQVISPGGQPTVSPASDNIISPAPAAPAVQPQAFQPPVQPTVTSQPFTAAPATPAPVKNKPKKTVLAAALVVLLIVIGGGAYAFFGRNQKPASQPNVANSAQSTASSPTGYESTIQKFITAVENKDKATADSLESPAAKATFKQYAGTESFYDSCQQSGVLCTGIFKPSYLSKATQTPKDYKASNGTKGKEIVYAVKQSLSGAAAGGQGCSSQGETDLTIAVVPSGRSWLVDNVDMGFSGSANACPASGSTSSSSNQ